MENAKVSVCIITYNQERLIAQAVESVLAQETNFPFEIVVGEDCSTDRTRSILIDLARRNPQTIRLRLPPENTGMCRNFAGTLQDCTGQYVAVLEGDDYWTSPHKLQKQADALDDHRDWAICFHPVRCIHDDETTPSRLFPDNWTRDEATLDDLFEENFMGTSSVMFRNRLFAELPPWFFDVKVGDWPFHMLNAAHGKIGFLPDVMAVYRLHAGGIWSQQSFSSRLAATFDMFSVVDHHFQGEYRRQIDRYRIGQVAKLAEELENVRRAVGQLQIATSELRTHSDHLEAERRSLSGANAAMREANAALHNANTILDSANRGLQDECKTLRESYAFRLGSLLTRPAGRVRRALRSVLKRGQSSRP